MKGPSGDLLSNGNGNSRFCSQTASLTGTVDVCSNISLRTTLWTRFAHVQGLTDCQGLGAILSKSSWLAILISGKGYFVWGLFFLCLPFIIRDLTSGLALASVTSSATALNCCGRGPHGGACLGPPTHILTSSSGRQRRWNVSGANGSTRNRGVGRATPSPSSCLGVGKSKSRREKTR